MPVLFEDNPKARADGVSATQTTTTAFTSAEDITTRKRCLITQIHASLPDGEVFSLDHVSKAGNAAPLLANQPKGTYALGEHFILYPGEALRPSSASVVSGTREITIKAIQIEQGV